MKRALTRLLTGALALGQQFLVNDVYVSGQALWALGLLVLATTGFAVYLSRGGFAWRYLFPGVAGMLLFVAFPLLYTAQIGFTNYSSKNLLALERVREYLLEQSTPDEGKTLGYTLHDEGGEFGLLLQPLH
jgi:maltose/maltodextrin transport system permease protein